MLFLDKLKQLLKFDLTIKDSFNIHINNKSHNTSEPYEYDESAKQLSINLDKIDGEILTRLNHLLAESINEDFIFLEQKSDERVNDIIETEKEDDIHQLLSFFSDKIPKNDFDALRSAVYIRNLFLKGTDYKIIYRLKGEVIQKYGTRGLNICNLCSSGYFENLLKPLYEVLKEGPSTVKFENVYNTIINEEAFAVFIQSAMTNHDVKNVIEKQIFRNLKYGIEYVNIHGIGHGNVQKIKEVIEKIEVPNYDIYKHVELDGNIILANLVFKK